MLMSKLRAQPNYLILGAQKSGTTSLYNYINEHPNAIAPRKREVHFFDGGLDDSEDNYGKGLGWYRSHFPYKFRVIGNRITGECSPLYLFHPLCPERIHAQHPDIKLVCIFRDPTERAISHYFHEVRKGREERTISEALEQEEATIGQCLSTREYSSTLYNKSYLHRGYYLELLQRYFKLFKKNQILTLSSEDLWAKPVEKMATVFNFLNVEDSFSNASFKPMNQGHNRTKVDPEVYNWLTHHFATKNEALFNHIGERFDWLSPAEA